MSGQLLKPKTAAFKSSLHLQHFHHFPNSTRAAAFFVPPSLQTVKHRHPVSMFSFLATVLAAAAVLSSVTTGLATPLQVRKVDITRTMEWYGPSNGANVTLHGTASEIMAQLKAADANWAPAAPLAITKRTPGAINCCPVFGEPWLPVSIQNLQIAMNQLAELGGVCGIAPRTCADARGSNGLVSCRFGAGIAICNDAYTTAYLSCVDVASYAYQIIQACPHVDGDTCGQIFDTDTGSWNVVLAQC